MYQIGTLVLILCISAEAFARLEPPGWLVRSPCKASAPEEESSPSLDQEISSSSASRDSAELQPSSPIIEYDDFLPQPNSEWNALGVVEACMDIMLERKDAGLEVCFNFSSDRCRAALGGSLEKFAQYATNPVFGYLVNCQDYKIISVGPVIEGTPTRGAMQTVLMDAQQQHAKGDSVEEEREPVDARRFLWTLQKERRPPRQGFWVIHEVIYVRNALNLTI